MRTVFSGEKRRRDDSIRGVGRSFGSGVLCVVLWCGVARAGTDIDYSRQPERFLNRLNTTSAGFCFFDPPDYVCVGKDVPYVVIAKAIPPGPLKTAIDANCSGLDASERNPSPDCRYGFQFLPTSFKRIVGDYAVRDRLRRDARIVEFRADRLEPRPMTP